MLYDIYAASKLGFAVSDTINSSAGAVRIYDLLRGDIEDFFINTTASDLPRPVPKPLLFVVYTTVEALVRQVPDVYPTGGGVFGALTLPAYSLWPVTVEGLSDNKLHYRSTTTTAGTIYILGVSEVSSYAG